MPDFGLMAQSLMVSAIAAGLTLLLIAGFGRGASPVRERAGWLAGLAAGIYTGCSVLDEWPRLPAPEDRDRFLVVLLPLTLAAEGVAAWARRGWLARLPRWGVAAAAAPILLHHSTYLADLDGPGSAQWSPVLAAAILLLLGASLACQWELMARFQLRSSRPTVAAVLALALLAAGITVMLSGYYRGGLFALPMAGAMAGATAAAWAQAGGMHSRLPKQEAPAAASPAGAEPAVGIGIVGLFTVLAIGRFFGSLPDGAMIGLFAAPLLAWTADLAPIRKLPPLSRAMVGIVAVMVPLVVIVVRAQIDFTAALATGSRPGELPHHEQNSPIR